MFLRLIEDILFLLVYALRGIPLLASRSVPALLRFLLTGRIRTSLIVQVGMASSLMARQIHVLLCLLVPLVGQAIQERG